MGILYDLIGLSFYENELTGEIPPELGNLTNLDQLDLAWNQLTGEIPPELGNLTNLKQLKLQANNLSGRYPRSLATSLIWRRCGFGEISSPVASRQSFRIYGSKRQGCSAVGQQRRPAHDA